MREKKAKNSKRTRGRPSVYEGKILPRLEDLTKWYADGDSLRTIAERLGVSYKALINAKFTHPECEQAFKNADRTATINEVKKSLAEMANGYTYEEEVVIENYDKEGNFISKTVKKFKHYAPKNALAASMFLKNNDRTWSENPAELELAKDKLELDKSKVSIGEQERVATEQVNNAILEQLNSINLSDLTVDEVTTNGD